MLILRFFFFKGVHDDITTTKGLYYINSISIIIYIKIYYTAWLV